MRFGLVSSVATIQRQKWRVQYRIRLWPLASQTPCSCMRPLRYTSDVTGCWHMVTAPAVAVINPLCCSRRRLRGLSSVEVFSQELQHGLSQMAYGSFVVTIPKRVRIVSSFLISVYTLIISDYSLHLCLISYAAYSVSSGIFSLTHSTTFDFERIISPDVFKCHKSELLFMISGGSSVGHNRLTKSSLVSYMLLVKFLAYMNSTLKMNGYIFIHIQSIALTFHWWVPPWIRYCNSHHSVWYSVMEMSNLFVFHIVIPTFYIRFLTYEVFTEEKWNSSSYHTHTLSSPLRLSRLIMTNKLINNLFSFYY